MSKGSSRDASTGAPDGFGVKGGARNGTLPESLKTLRLEPVTPEDKLKLGSKAARVDDPPPRAEIEAATAQLLQRLTDLQDAFHADRRHALLLVLQGRDAAGKDGVIKTVYGAFNPTGVSVASFGPPTPIELRHDFLWRVHQVVPALGMVGVFNRSHYEDVLAVRVRELAPESVWRPRYKQINHFERMLAENRVVIRKCMLHVSREEQRGFFMMLAESFDPDPVGLEAAWNAYRAEGRSRLPGVPKIPTAPAPGASTTPSASRRGRGETS